MLFGFTYGQLLTLVLIFSARILDVSFGTLRIIMVGRGLRLFASILGFFEVLIWLLAIGQVLQNLQGWVSYVTYAAGFAAGTYIGMSIERRLSFGRYLIRIITPEEDTALISKMQEHKIKITKVEGQGANGPVHVVFSIVNRISLKRVLELVRTYQPDAFYSIEDVRQAKEFSAAELAPLPRRPLLQPFYWFRKSK